MSESEIFKAAVNLPADQRAAYLDQACGANGELRREIESLLQAHDASGGFLQDRPAQSQATTDQQPATVQAGAFIGPYKLLQHLGEGGMGTVWVAEQTQPVKRRVALKIIKAGMDSAQVLRRFEAERQALALMDHTNIAKVFDAGTTTDFGGVGQGRPYFVMELIPGVVVTKYCDELNLPIRERLDLFIPVCRAIQHAHQRGIIHRDIKPSNVLVSVQDGRPVPKVIDFGVAKALHQQLGEQSLYTEFGAVIGTLEYMSPEQAEMSPLGVDTRADVYALGVMLYELLTGSTPLDKKRLRGAAYGEMIRLIKEEEPLKPSTRLSQSKETLASLAAHRRTDPARLVQELRVELDWIVMKCLEKDRGRRYESASSLARDVERHLNDEPVEACPPSTAYRLSKFWRKHKGPVIAVGLVLLALICGVVGTTWGLVEASRAKDIAQSNAREAIAEKAKAEAAALDEERAKRDAVKAERAEASARKYAEDERDAKDRALVRADGLRLTALSELVRPSNPGRALLLAIEGAQRAPGLLANNALVAAMEVCAEDRTLSGHEGNIEGAIFSPDNKHVLSWSADKTARIWDVQTGKQLRQLDHSAAVSFARFSPDGQRILTIAAPTGVGGPGGKTVYIWDSTTGRRVTSWNAGDLKHFGGEWFPIANPASLSPDGKRVVVTYCLYPNNPPSIHETDSGKPLAVLQGHKAPVLEVNFSPDGRQVVTAALDGTAGVWDADTGKLLHSLKGHKGGITSAKFSPDGRRVLTVGDGWEHEFGPNGSHGEKANTATREEVAGRIWDAATGKELAALQWPPDQKWFVRSARFSKDGTKVLTAGFTGFPSPVSTDQLGRITASLPRVWDAATGKLVESFQWTAPESPTTAEFSPDGHTVLSMVNGKVIQLGDATTGKELSTFRGHDENVVTAAFSPDSKRIVTVGRDRTIRLWDASFAAKSAPQHRRWFDAWWIALTPDRRHMLHHQGDLLDGSLRLWELDSGREVWKSKCQPLAQADPMLSADGERFAVRFTNSVGVWDTRTGKELFALDSKQGLGGAAALSPDGKRLIFKKDLATDKGAHIWDVDTKAKLATLEGDTAYLGRIQFSRDGERLLTTDNGYGAAGAGRRTTLAKLFNTATGKQAGLLAKEYVDLRFLGSNYPKATFSRDGQRILTAFSNEAILWDARSFKELMVFTGHTDVVPFAAFSHDEQRVVTTSHDRTARLWDTATGKQLHVLKCPEDSVMGAAFSPNGARVVTWQHAITRLWDSVTGNELVTWRSANPGSGVSAQFSIDGQWLIIRSPDGVRFWPVDPLSAAMEHRPRDLTAQEREQFEIR